MERTQGHKMGALCGWVAACMSSFGAWGPWYSQSGGDGMDKMGALCGWVAACMSSFGAWGPWYSQSGGDGMVIAYEMALAQED
jgi:hypothetical protein